MSSTLELQTFRKKLDHLVSRKTFILDNREKTEKKRRSLQRLSLIIEKALLISQQVAKLTQEELEFQISALVTNALESIFPDPYTFRVQFEIKRGRTEAVMAFLRGDEELNPLTATGGGCVDVASFALRLSSYLIAGNKLPPIMILDEPFRFISADYQEAVADLLNEMSDRLGVQFILVTHEESLKDGNVIEM